MNQYALIIGVGQREEDNPAMAVTSKDATRVATELEQLCGISPENIALITEENATKERVFAELEKVHDRTQANEADLVWIYFSGHGCRISETDEVEYFLLTNDTINSNLRESAINGADFIGKINQIKSKRVLLLLDCCHSGGIREERSNIPFEKNNLLSHPNRIIISASSAEQVSFASQPLSVFTYAFIEAISGVYLQETDKKDITVFDLAMYIRERVYPLTKRTQRPELNILNNESTENFVLLAYSDGIPARPVFETDFRLFASNEKEIDLSTKIEKDDEYRKEFSWLKDNKGIMFNQIGDNNIQNFIINIGSKAFPLGNAILRSDTEKIKELLIEAGIFKLTPQGIEIEEIYKSIIRANDKLEANTPATEEPHKEIQGTFSEKGTKFFNILSLLWNTGIILSIFGMLIIIWSNYMDSDSISKGVTLFSGLICILVNVVLFALIKFKGLDRGKEILTKNDAAISNLQKISYNLAMITRHATSYTNENSEVIRDLLVSITPNLEKLGLITNENRHKFNSIGQVVKAVNNYSKEIEDTIKELEKALVEGDARKLKAFVIDTKALVDKIKQLDSQG